MELQDWKLSELGEDIWKKKYQSCIGVKKGCFWQ